MSVLCYYILHTKAAIHNLCKIKLFATLSYILKYKQMLGKCTFQVWVGSAKDCQQQTTHFLIFSLKGHPGAEH